MGKLFLLGCVLAGCYATATTGQLHKRAAFDLGCEQVRLLEIDDRTQGVTGCGKRATYVEQCDGPRNNPATTCTWILNGTVADDGAAPAPAHGELD